MLLQNHLKHQPHATNKQSFSFNTAPSEIVPPSSFFHTVYPIILQPLKRQLYCTFVVMNKSENTTHGLGHRFAPEASLHQTYAYEIFVREQHLYPVAEKQGHKRKLAIRQCSLSGRAASRFLRVHELYEKNWSPFVSAFITQVFRINWAQVEAQALTTNQTDAHAFTP